MIKRNMPEMLIADILSVQPMTCDVSDMFAFTTGHIDNKPKLTLDWTSYGSPYKTDLFDQDYTVLSTTFNEIEEKDRREDDETIGNVFETTYKGVVTTETVESKDLLYITQYERYLKFKEKYQDGDIVVYFKSPLYTWHSLCGREGFAIIRDGIIIDKMITMLN